jgi:hypothetical protein
MKIAPIPNKVLHYTRYGLSTLALLMVASAATVTLARAEAPTFTMGLAYVDGTGNVKLEAAGTTTAAPITQDANFDVTVTTTLPVHNYTHLRWSPDGSKLAYQDSSTRNLYVVTPGSAPKLVASNIMSEYQTAWLPDSSAVVYAVNTQQTAGDLKYTINLQQVAPDGSNPHVIASFAAQEGCGGGGFSLAEVLYDMETGFGGNLLSLAWTKYGWLVSTSCAGNGLALVGLNNQVLWTAPSLGRAAVSPSGALAMAIVLNTSLRPTTMVTLDLSSGHFTVSSVAPIVDQIGWSADEQNLFYSTITGNQVTLWKVPVNGTTAVPLFADHGSSIGTIKSSPDSQTVVFSLISDSNPPQSQLLAVAAAGNPANSPATLTTAGVISLGSQPAFAVAVTLAAAPPVITLVPTLTAAPPCVLRADWQYSYAVAPGDTLSGIALRAGVTTDVLAQGNCLTNVNAITSGQVLRVPIAVQPPTLGIKRITFPPGGTGAVVTGQVAKYPALDHWVIRVNAGQTLSVQLTMTSGNAILIIYGANGAVLLSNLAHAPSFSAIVPLAQDYFIDVADVSGAGSTYTMTVNVPPLVQPIANAQRISFGAGAISAVVNGQTGVNGTNHWVIRILAGQTLTAQLNFLSGNAIMIVYGADGSVLQTDHAGSSNFQGAVPLTEDYYIDIRDASGIGTSYSLTITIPPH